MSEEDLEGSLVLDGRGLSISRSDGGDESFIEFGIGQGETLARVAAILDIQPIAAENDECGAGPMEFAAFDGLFLNFQDDKFVGWHLRRGAKQYAQGLPMDSGWG